LGGKIVKIIKPSYEILHDTGDMFLNIERVARVCYKSEDKICEGSAKKMVRALTRSNHEAMLEHHSLIFEITNIEDYMKFCEYISFLKSRGGTCMLRTTFINRGVVSGNIRMWRDFLRSAITLIDELLLDGMLINNEPLVPKIVADLLSYKQKWPIVFDDLDIDLEKFNLQLFDDYEFIELHPTQLSNVEKEKHFTITVKFSVDRGVGNEIVRHRIASFAQESTRYCNYSKGSFGNEITVIEPCFFEEGTEKYNWWYGACLATELAYLELLRSGATPQQARDVLPLSLKSELCMTATIESWKHFFDLRALDKTGAAHPQMKEVTIPLLEDLKKLYPELF
jgi:thymidylate synthase (FAD)